MGAFVCHGDRITEHLRRQQGSLLKTSSDGAVPTVRAADSRRLSGAIPRGRSPRGSSGRPFRDGAGIRPSATETPSPGRVQGVEVVRRGEVPISIAERLEQRDVAGPAPAGRKAGAGRRARRDVVSPIRAFAAGETGVAGLVERRLLCGRRRAARGRPRRFVEIEGRGESTRRPR